MHVLPIPLGPFQVDMGVHAAYVLEASGLHNFVPGCLSVENDHSEAFLIDKQ